MPEDSPPIRERDKSAHAGWDTRTWVSLASLTTATFALVFTEFLPAGLLTPMAEGLSVSKGMAGQTVTATGISGMFSALLLGLVIGRLDRRAVMLALCALAVVANLTAALTPDFTILLVARVLVGIALGGFWTLVTAVVARLVSIESIGKGMTVIMIGVSAAAIAAPPLGALIAEFFGWRTAFGVAAGAAALALGAEFFTLPRLAATNPVRLRMLARIAKRPKLQVGLLAVVTIAGGHFAGFTYIRAVLEGVTHLTPTRVAEVLLGYGVINFLGNFAGGIIADRNLRLALGTTGVLIGAATLSLAAFGADPLSAGAAVVLWGFAFGAAPVVLQTWAARAVPDQLEAMGGLFIATFQISIASGAAIGGAIVDHYGVIDVMIFTGVMALAAASLSTLRPK
jgi:DHA1 family purine ribonucleoside efflux pump-like MFS transporter